MDNTKTSFLDLPAEIRSTIYELALVQEKPIRISNLPNWNPEKYAKRLEPTVTPKGHLAYTSSVHVLRACKVVNTEATPILYGANHLHFIEGRFFIGFATAVRASIRHVRHVQIDPLITASKEHIQATCSRLKWCLDLQQFVILRAFRIPGVKSLEKLDKTMRGPLQTLKKERKKRGLDFDMETLITVTADDVEACAKFSHARYSPAENTEFATDLRARLQELLN